MCLPLLFLACLLSLFAAPVAHAAEADWRPGFDRALDEGRLDLGGAVLLVRSGAAHDELDAARAALSGALLDAGRAEALLDDAPLGALLGLDDAAILEKARALPVAHVLVLRVYPGPKGRPPSALVMVYDVGGSLLDALRVSAREGLTPIEIQDPAAWPDDVGTREPSAPTPAAPKRAVESTRLPLDDEALRARYPDWLTLGDIDAFRYPAPRVGPGQRRLEGEALYTFFGREDLVKRYREADGGRSLARYAGIGMVVTGGGLLGCVYCSLVTGAASSLLIANPQLGFALGGAALAGLALVPSGALVGTFLGGRSPHPLSREEILELVKAHNTRLLAGERPSAAAPPDLSVDVE